jgi:transposase
LLKALLEVSRVRAKPRLPDKRKELRRGNRLNAFFELAILWKAKRLYSFETNWHVGLYLTEKRSITLEKSKSLIVTIDIGKMTNTGYYRCPDGNEAKPFEFSNNGWGFNTFWHRISQAQKFHNLTKIVIGFESTGCYAEPLLHYLRKRKVELVQVNPMHTKRLKELQGNSPNKTDKKDPKVIADIICLGHGLSLIVPEGIAAHLRRLTQARERSIKQRTALFNQLQELMFIIFPEFLQVMKNIKTKTARYLLKYYPTPEDIVNCNLEPLILTVRKVSRGNLGKDCAETLYKAAMSSVGIKEGRASILLEIRQILANIETSNRFIDNIEKHMSDYLGQINYSKLMLSIKGIGKITTAGLIGEVGDFSKFRTVSEITKLAGLDLFEISSGKHKGKRRISKRGRSHMRKILYLAAISAVRKGSAMHEYYQKCLQKGMVKMKALIAVARKLLRVIFALVRDNKEFITGYVNQQNLALKEVA